MTLSLSVQKNQMHFFSLHLVYVHFFLQYDLNRVPPLTKLLLWPTRICCQAILNYINDRLLPEECSCHPLSPSIMALLHFIFCFCR